jgi:pyridoxamine 5'-phosphate oxidase
VSLADIRREYLGEPLDEAHADSDPLRQFAVWFEQVKAVEPDPTAMALATATRDGRPSVRTVLLKAADERGFVFFTSYESRKARELAESGRASLLFFWRSVERQVRIDGSVERVTSEESDAYFATRPLESRLSVHAARQSEVLDSRATLERRVEAARQSYPDGRVPRPASWGGYRIVPDEIEFWQGRESRLHDRLQYRRRPDGSWIRERLAP